MTLEATVDKKSKRKPNPAVEALTQELTDDSGVASSIEDQAVVEARRMVTVQQPSAQEEEQALQEASRDDTPAFEHNPFRREDAQPPAMTPKMAREERAAIRDSKQTQSPSAKRMGPLGKKVPGPEHLKVHKRLDDGGLGYVGDYTASDMSQSQDIETFLNRYVKAKFGPGEYALTGVDAHGRSYDMGFVTLLGEAAPPPPEASSISGRNPLDLAQTLIDTMSRRHEQEIAAIRSNQKDPIRMMKELHELQQQMAPAVTPVMPTLTETPKRDKGEDATTTLLTGMMGMMTTVLASALAPKPPDPIMMAVLAKLTEDKPVAPVQDSTAQLKNLAEIVAMMRPAERQQDDRLTEYLLKERMTPNEVLSLVNQVKGERGTDDFKKTMENMGFLMNAVNQIRSQTEPGAGAGFMDMLTAVLGNRELMGGLVGNRIRQQQAAPPQMQVQARNVDPVENKRRMLEAKRLEIEEQELHMRERALQEGRVAFIPPTAAPSAPAVAQVPEPDQVLSTPVTEEDQQRAMQNVQAAGGPKQLPAFVPDYINRYVEAKDEAELVEITVDFLFAFADDEAWQPFAERIIALALQSDRARFMHHAASFFVGIRTIGLISEEMARKIVEALNKNFDIVAETMKEQAMKASSEEDEDEDEGEGEEDDDSDEGGEPYVDLLKPE